MIKNQFYKQVPGDFTFSAVYDEAIRLGKDLDIFVEVGSLLGSSICYLTHASIEANKNIKIYAIDTWEGEDNNSAHAQLVRSLGGADGFYNKFIENMQEARIHKIVNAIRMRSVEAAKEFSNECINFCFLDAGHTYSDIHADIEAYWPKIKKGGILAGHDYHEGNDVVRAVNEFVSYNRGYILEFRLFFLSRSWMVIKSHEYFN